MKVKENCGAFVVCGGDEKEIKTLNYWRTWDGRDVYTVTNWDLNFFKKLWTNTLVAIGLDYLEVMEF